MTLYAREIERSHFSEREAGVDPTVRPTPIVGAAPAPSQSTLIQPLDPPPGHPPARRGLAIADPRVLANPQIPAVTE